MASLLDSRLGLGLACAVAVAIGGGAVVWLQGGAARHAVPAAPAQTASAWDGPIGPGALPRGTPANDLALAQAGMGDQPLADAEGHLLVDARLRSVFDSYLLAAKGPARDARAAELRTWLRSRLGQPALGQATDLVSAYLRYLQAESELRARARFTRPDPAGLTDAQVDQMVAWQQTRAQLRERMLGTAVAQAWFGADDADCSTAFADWRKQREPRDAPDLDSNELRDRRLHGAVLEERRNERAQTCASQLMDGLAQQ
jgi:hypothetical protein